MFKPKNFGSKKYWGQQILGQKKFGYQGGDSSAGKQALPVGKIIEALVFRKDNQKI